MNAVAPSVLVELDGFGKSYRSGWIGPRIPAVRSLTLQVPAGEVLGLLGPNGSGKSTTLKALAGLLRPTAGTCRIGGHLAGSNEARALVGYLPESPRFAPQQTAREFLRYCAGLSSLPGDQVTRRIAEVLDWIGLGPAADRTLGTFSKGMRQRLGLAQAVLHRPPVVLLDEPASGLDPAGRLALGALIRDLAGRGTTVIFSSHFLAQAESICDRLAILGRGRLLACGSPAELLGAAVAPRPAPSALERLYLEKLHEDECVSA